MTPLFDDRGIVVSCGLCEQKNRLMYEHLGNSATCGRCKETLPALSEPIEIGSAADFDRLIAHASIPVIVDYWAPWCGPCRVVAPELQKVAARNPRRYLVIKVNTDVLDDLG